MVFIEPLALETIFINVVSGTPEIFGAIAFMLIAGLAAFFRMNGVTMFFMIGVFFVMFSVYVGAGFLILFGIIGGLLIGYALSRFLSVIR